MSSESWNIPLPPNPTGLGKFQATPTPKQLVAESNPVTVLEVFGLRIVMTLKVYRWWESIFKTVTAPGTSQDFTLQTHKGVSSTDMEKSTFTKELGFEENVDFLALGNTLTQKFTWTSETIHSVTLTDNVTETIVLRVQDSPERVTIDYWQMMEQYELTRFDPVNYARIYYSSASLTSRVRQYVVTSYPETKKEFVRAEVLGRP